jgi:hypothetical protein
LLISAFGTQALGLLRSLAATGAPFDSLDRSPAAKCHEGTRSEILHKIYAWISDHQGTKLCWVHGPAGAGKSAIAQTVAERCADQEQLAASFFFSRSAPSRDTARLFFVTLAWQLASSMPGTKDAICKAVVDGSRILDQKHEAQIDHLIVRPFLASTDSSEQATSTNPFLVIIDGLDECKPIEDQTRLLNHLYKLVEDHRFPLRFLIVSRPEAHIRHFFTIPRNKNISTEISIHGDYQAREDIYRFLRSRFDEIAESGRHFYSLEYERRPWPSDEIVKLLRDRSEGYFIYASTVLKCIDDENYSCVKRLEEVLNASDSGSSTSIFGELDKLYTQILSACPNIHLLVRVLGGLLGTPIHQWKIQVECLELVYNLGHGEIMQMLRNFHSVLEFTTGKTSLSEYTDVRCHHASFLDFLFDKGRAGPYYINKSSIIQEVYGGMVSFISDYPSRRSSIEYWLISVQKYSCIDMSCPRQIRSQEYLLFDSLQYLFRMFFNHSLESQTVFLDLLSENTLNKWKTTIVALPPLPDTHHLPFLLMLLSAHRTFSNVRF